MPTSTLPTPLPITANPTTPTSLPVNTVKAVSAPAPAPTPASAPSSAATSAPYVSETPSTPGPGNTPSASLPSSQASMLENLANLSLSYANPVGPGQVTAQQQQVLQAWQQNANSDYSQYMMSRGMSAAAQDPNALFSEEALSTQATWSQGDTQSALQTLKLSATDWDQYQKIEEENKSNLMKTVFGVVELAAGIAIDVFAGWTGVGAVAGTAIAAQGAKTLSSESSSS